MIFCVPSGEVLGKNSLARSEIEYRIIEYKIQGRSQQIFACGGLIEIVTLDVVNCENHFQKVDLILLIFFRTEILVQISSSLVWDHHKSENEKSPPKKFRLRRAACILLVPCIRFAPLQPVFANFWFGREKIRSLTVDRKSISNCLIISLVI